MSAAEVAPERAEIRENVRELLGNSCVREDLQWEISLISTLAYPLDSPLLGGFSQ